MEWKYDGEKIYSLNEAGEMVTEVTLKNEKKGIVNIETIHVNEKFSGLGHRDLTMKILVAFLREKELKATTTSAFVRDWFQVHLKDHSEIFLPTRKQAEAS